MWDMCWDHWSEIFFVCIVCLISIQGLYSIMWDMCLIVLCEICAGITDLRYFLFALIVLYLSTNCISNMRFCSVITDLWYIFFWHIKHTVIYLCKLRCFLWKTSELSTNLYQKQTIFFWSLLGHFIFFSTYEDQTIFFLKNGKQTFFFKKNHSPPPKH